MSRKMEKNKKVASQKNRYYPVSLVPQIDRVLI